MKYYKITENNITYDIKEYANGDKFWYLNGNRHRENGPAIERSNGDKYWYKNGKCHREDGPAIKYLDGYKEYWHDGKYLNIDLDEELKRHIKLLAIL